AEWDLNDQITAWAAGGIKRGKEDNSLTTPTMVARSGAATTTRFDTQREDDTATGEIGLRGRFATGTVKHQVVASASWFRAEERNAWEYNFSPVPINIYNPVGSDRLGGTTITGNLSDPNRAAVNNLQSYALADTLSFY